MILLWPFILGFYLTFILAFLFIALKDEPLLDRVVGLTVFILTPTFLGYMAG